MSTSLRLILELQSKTTLLEQSSTKTGPLEAATLDHRSAGPNGYEVGFGIEDSGSLHGNVSERVLSRPYSLFSFSWCTFQDTPWRFCSPRVSPCCVSTDTSTLLQRWRAIDLCGSNLSFPFCVGLHCTFRPPWLCSRSEHAS